MTKIILLACLLTWSAGAAVAQRSNSVLMPESDVRSVVHQCSRWTPKFEKPWTPKAAEISEMEKKFSDLEKLRAGHRRPNGVKAEGLDVFYMQYAGVVVGGKKFIYINAFPPLEFYKETSGEDWWKRPISVCDGGSRFWGVFYDVGAGKFSDYAENGTA